MPDLLAGVHLDNSAEEEKIRTLAKTDKKEGRLKSILKSANRYLELKPSIIGTGGNFNAFFDDVLKWDEQ